MRKTKILAIFFVTAGLAYGANDVWKTKPYQQWDQNDLKEILTNSPWVKKTTVMAAWANGGAMAPNDASGQATQGQQNQNQAAQRPGAMNGAAGGNGSVSPGTAEQAPSMPQEPEATFFVRWNSALTEREAVARSALLSNQFSQAQAEQYVNQEPATYDVVVYGRDMTPFANETEDNLKAEAYLEVKPSKEKVNPTSVKINKGSDGKVQTLFFSFPKQGSNGQQLITANDKQAQFDCKTKIMHLSTQFDLRKMVGKNGQEL
jgi:hypothetical protein